MICARDLILKAHTTHIERRSTVASHANVIFKHIFHRWSFFELHCFLLNLVGRSASGAGPPLSIFSE